jgi:hypothetical protein
MKQQSEFEKGRAGAMAFGGIVYVGVVIAATTLFISFVLTAFPAEAYFSRFVMVVGGLMVGGSMLAFPVALHTWAISGQHRAITIGLYYLEMAIIALNTVVSFAALLYRYASAPMPAWITWYEPFSIVSIIYTLFAWGTIFLTDPSAKAKAEELAAQQTFDRRKAAKKTEYLDSIEGEQAIMDAANAEIAQEFKSKVKKAEHFGAARGIPAPAPFVRNEATTEKPDLGESFRS